MKKGAKEGADEKMGWKKRTEQKEKTPEEEDMQLPRDLAVYFSCDFTRTALFTTFTASCFARAMICLRRRNETLWLMTAA